MTANLSNIVVAYKAMCAVSGFMTQDLRSEFNRSLGWAIKDASYEELDKLRKRFLPFSEIRKIVIQAQIEKASTVKEIFLAIVEISQSKSKEETELVDRLERLIQKNPALIVEVKSLKTMRMAKKYDVRRFVQLFPKIFPS